MFTKCVDPLRQVGFRFDTPCFLDSLLDDPLNLRSVVSQGGGITDPMIPFPIRAEGLKQGQGSTAIRDCA